MKEFNPHWMHVLLNVKARPVFLHMVVRELLEVGGAIAGQTVWMESVQKEKGMLNITTSTDSRKVSSYLQLLFQ